MMTVTVTVTPALAQTSGNAPDYVLKEEGTVIIDGDGATDCTSFAFFLEQGTFESGNISPGAQRVLEQCEEAGFLNSEGVSAVDGESETLPETGGSGLTLTLAAAVLASGLLARKAAW